MFKKMLNFILHSEDNQRQVQTIKNQIMKESDKTIEKVRKTNKILVKKSTTFYLAKVTGRKTK